MFFYIQLDLKNPVIKKIKIFWLKIMSTECRYQIRIPQIKRPSDLITSMKTYSSAHTKGAENRNKLIFNFIPASGKAC
jgi:hypothetical protein